MIMNDDSVMLISSTNLEAHIVLSKPSSNTYKYSR